MRASANSGANLARVASISFCLIAMLVLSAFSIPLQIEILNNSGGVASIFFKGDQHDISTIEIKSGQKATIASLLERSFVIKIGSEVKRYRGRLLPEALVDYRGWGPFLKRVLRVRLESNGCIIFIRPKKIHGQQDTLKQPDGFPICPER